MLCWGGGGGNLPYYVALSSIHCYRIEAIVDCLYYSLKFGWGALPPPPPPPNAQVGGGGSRPPAPPVEPPPPPPQQVPRVTFSAASIIVNMYSIQRQFCRVCSAAALAHIFQRLPYWLKGEDRG